MLYLLTSSLFLAAQVLGQSTTCVTGQGKDQSGENNYVIDDFTGLSFSYAIGQCTGVNLLDTDSFAKFTCSKDNTSTWMVTKSTYATKACTTPLSTLSWTNAETVEGETGFFKCDGGNNYAHVQISLVDTCEGALDVYGGLGGCAVNSAALDTKFYCNATIALVQLYKPGNSTIGICSDEHSYCNSWNFKSTCDLSASLSGLPVYGKALACETDMTGATTTTGSATESSAKSQFTILGAVIALVVALFH
jgi:hypothetical protein